MKDKVISITATEPISLAEMRGPGADKDIVFKCEGDDRVKVD